MCTTQATPSVVPPTATVISSASTKKYPIRIEGHRGAGHLAPENSLKAFIRAIELGIDGVEFDVWLTKDNVPVVVHGLPGGIVEFEGDVNETISQIDSEALKNYTLKNGEKIPSLVEVLDACNGKVNLNIEIKELREEVIEKVLVLIEERNMFEQITFSSFNHQLRAKLTHAVTEKKITNKVTFGFLMELEEPNFPDYELTLAQEGDSINVDIRYLENHREECLAQIKKAQEKQVKIKFWFPMEYMEEDMFYEELLGLSVDTIITNKPHSMIEYFAKQSVCV